MSQTINEMMNTCRSAGWPCTRFTDFDDYKEIAQGNWLIVVGRSRDSEFLEGSNFEVAQKMLEKAGGKEGSDFEIERHGHWACGWVEFLIVNPNRRAMVIIAQEIETALDSHPVLDDSDLSEREYNYYKETVDNELEDSPIPLFWEFWDEENLGIETESVYEHIEKFKETLPQED